MTVPCYQKPPTRSSVRSCVVCRNSNFGSLGPILFLLNFPISSRLSTMKSTLFALFCTFFEIFDVPEFWPILVMYFFILTFLTMKRQIMVREIEIKNFFDKIFNLILALLMSGPKFINFNFANFPLLEHHNFLF